MFKKTFYILGLVLFTTLLVSASARPVQAQDNTDTGGECKFPWIGCSISVPDADWSNTFGTDDPEKAGQDLYEIVYQANQANPEKKALKNTTAKYGVSEAEMVKMVYGSYEPILKRSPLLTQEQAIQKMLEIQREYQDEKDLLSLQADIDSEVVPNEIFANGDLGDSGFDLVNDLGNIEDILFKKNTPVDVGGAYSPEENGVSTGGSGGAGKDSSKNGSNNNNNSAKNGSKSGPNQNSTGGNNGTPANGVSQTPSPQEDPNVCLVPNSLNAALNQFEKNKAVDANYADNVKGPLAGSTANSGESASASGTAYQTSPDLTANNPPAALAKSAPADNWLKNPPCNDVFCLSINFVKKPATLSYQDDDNCIACHLEKINAKLKETINHNLIPGKTTGNVLEPGVCKKAAGGQISAVGLKFYVSFKPVVTPTNDDLIYGASIQKEWEQFMNTYKAFKAPTKKDPDAKPETPPSEEDRATKTALSFAAPEVTFDALTKDINETLDQSAQARAHDVAIAEAAFDSEMKSTFYQAIQRELEQMNFYFENIQSILKSFQDKGGVCPTLNDKKECS